MDEMGAEDAKRRAAEAVDVPLDLKSTIQDTPHQQPIDRAAS